MSDVLSNPVATVLFVDDNRGLRKEYDYFVPEYMKDKLRPQDFAVVLDTNSRITLVQISSLSMCELGTTKANKYLIGTVDVSVWKEAKAAEARKKSVLEKLESFETRRKNYARFEELAKTNPEAAALFEDYKKLDGYSEEAYVQIANTVDKPAS